MSRILLSLTLIACFSWVANAQLRVAIAHLRAENITGSIMFSETDGGVRVTGNITGLPAGLYGFHVHALGDTTTCDTTGSHFNPDVKTHGGRDHEVRHIGDLGNVEFVGNESAVAQIDFVDSLIALEGHYSVLGRALVLHEQEDDLGLGGHESSNTTGNAGARVACGVIGIHSPEDPWNSAEISNPSIVLLLLTVFAFFLIKF